METNWYPPATKLSWGKDGGSMIGGPPRGVIHETQTVGVPNYNNGGSAPHLTLKKDGTWLQHSPFFRAARALRNRAGGVQTNRQGSVNIQIEVLAYSDKNDWTTAQILAMKAFMVWAEEEWGIPNIFPLDVGAGEQYGYGNPVELSMPDWEAFTGWCAHQHVPENTHWDVGRESGLTKVFGPSILEEDMFVKYGDKSRVVEMWQHRLGVTPDGDYGPLTKAAIVEKTSSDGMEVGPYEAAALMDMGVIPPVQTTEVPTPLSVMGAPIFTYQQALRWALREKFEHGSPYDDINIRMLVDFYWSVGQEYGVRPDLALAQSAKETGYWSYRRPDGLPGDVGPWQWNFAGIGATGGVPGITFETMEDGVRSHVLRMRMYAVNDASWYLLDVLQRELPSYLWGKSPYIQDFDGRWAVPGDGYGDSVVNNYLRKMSN